MYYDGYMVSGIFVVVGYNVVEKVWVVGVMICLWFEWVGIKLECYYVEVFGGGDFCLNVVFCEGLFWEVVLCVVVYDFFWEVFEWFVCEFVFLVILGFFGVIGYMGVWFWFYWVFLYWLIIVVREYL